MLSEHSYTNYTPQTIRKTYPSRKICTVPKCLNRSYRYTKTSLHRFPQNELRAEWGRILHIKTIPKNAYACSDHFIPSDYACLNKGVGKIRRLKKTAVPSRNLPQDDTLTGAAMTDLEKKNCIYQFRGRKNVASTLKTLQPEIKSTANENIQANPEFISVDEIKIEPEFITNDYNPIEAEFIVDNSELPTNSTTDHLPEFKSNMLPQVELKIDESTQTETTSTSQCTQTEADPPSQSTQTEAEFLQILRTVTMLDTLCTDEKVQEYTGLESTRSFKRLCDTFARLEPKMHSVGHEAKLEDQILLTLMKLKINCSFLCLSAIFHISTESATRYFFQTLHTMYHFLKHLIPWPSREEVQKNLPTCFDRFPNVRVVLDYVDFPVACCGCSACGLHCYSQYQKAHTLKAEIGVSPAGLITHVSTVYGGRATDKYMFGKLGILDKLESGDGVITVKNVFVQSECDERGVKLIQPGFANSQNFALQTAEDIYSIAQARVNAQRSVQRLKIFKILSDKVSWQMAPHFDEILGVICGITNLLPPLLADDEFHK